MIKPHKLFRFIWRVNAVLILVATTVVTLGVVSAFWYSFVTPTPDDSATAPVLGGPDTSRRLSLAQMRVVAGSGVLRGELVERDSSIGIGSGSGPYSQTRNFLFVDTKSSASQWLLPDDDRIVTEHVDIEMRDEGRDAQRVVATVALIKDAGDLEAGGGTLLLFDPTGLKVLTVANGVRDLHTATINPDGMLTVLFDRQRKYVLATFDTGSLEKKSEQELTLPSLK